MPATPDDLFRLLAALDIEVRTVRHPAVYTVEEAKRLRGDLPGLHVKNLFLKDRKGGLWLLVAREDRPVALKELAQRLGVKGFSFASAELLLEVLGVEPGAVTPFALINDSRNLVTLLLDGAVSGDAFVNFHPLVNTATTTISAAGFLRFVTATGHEPRFVDL
jgi:Ala-tRNA(Pro) deacylase